MKILVTGGFGNVGRSAVNACLAAGHSVTILESPSALKRAKSGLQRIIRTRWRQCGFVFGDIRSPEDVKKALSSIEGGPDAIIHLAAILPPASERDERRTMDINTGGAKNLVDACRTLGFSPRLVLASSIAIYGDRLTDFWIGAEDAVRPSDFYSRSKVDCEKLVRESGLDFVILRLSYVVWAKWLPFSPMLFAMPPKTRIEVVHTEDAGRAFASAAATPGVEGRTFDIGGGALCRTNFRSYMDRIFRYHGLSDSGFLDDSYFAAGDFHCGWYTDSDEAEEKLHFRSKTLEDYYEEVRWDRRWLAPLIWLVGPVARKWLAMMSPFKGARRKRQEAGSSRILQPTKP